MHTVVLVLGIGLYIAIAIGDIRTRRIRNEFIVAILALTCYRFAVEGDARSDLYTLAAGAALFVATFLLFWRGLLGGGDVKLAVATGLLVGYRQFFEFLFVMSVSGALVAVAVLARSKLGPRRATTPALEDQEEPEVQEPPARLTVPYGVAIAVAAIVSLLIQYFPSR